MTESSSSPASSIITIISPRHDLENDVFEMSSSPDIQSQLKLAIDRDMDSSPAVSNQFFCSMSHTLFNMEIR